MGLEGEGTVDRRRAPTPAGPVTGAGRRARRAVAVLTVAAVAVVACGGGAGGGDGAGAVDPEPTGAAVATDPDAGSTDAASPDPGAAPELADQCPVAALDGATEPVTITVWHAMQVELEETLTALTQRYQASQDRVRVELVFQGGYEDALDKYLTALRGGVRPTVVQLADVALQLGVDSGSFVPLQACVEAARYDLSDHLERVVSAYTVDGVLWPMPFNTATPVLYANGAALRQAGVSELPATLDEVRSAARAVVDAGVAPSGLALTTHAGLVEQWFALADQPLVDGGNGRRERATELLLDTDLGRELFGWLSAMVADGLATNVGSGDNAEHFIAIATGQAAMTIETSAALRSVLVVSTQFPDVEVAVGPMPSLGERTGGVLVGGGAMWLDAATEDLERAAAWDYLRWLSEPAQQAEWHAGTGYLPIRHSAVESGPVAQLWAAEPEFRIAYDQLVEGPATTATAGPVIGNHPLVRRRAVEAALERMWLQGQDPVAAVAQADADGDAVIADYNRRVRGG
jgi:sn-glycerol 3-phosphate transport system substrate-binding protein